MSGTALAPVSAQELDSKPSLGQLEQRLRGSHEMCISKVRQGMEHALRAGEVLLEIRSELMPKKEWYAWLERTPIVSRTQAYTYMRLFTYRDHLPEGFQGIRSGEVFLKGLPALGTDKGRARLSDKKAGGALAEAYSMAERLDDILGQAHREATEPEVRRELTRAHEYQHAMRDAIVRTLGVSG